eukprot:TRINITY_DN312_c0_g1_i2.p1 TRINITY_DN312_c0_g1~~TRINITY_DN312_c0_g1_i2.p1  ORF type:complete len:114 (-),score=1.89 TRINITY_DN312_c0_g1_i2:41-382(-)
MVNVARDQRRGQNSLLCSDSSNRRIEFKSRRRDSDLRLCHWSITSNPTQTSAADESDEVGRRLLAMDDTVDRLSSVDVWRSSILESNQGDTLSAFSAGFCLQVFSLRANKYFF